MSRIKDPENIGLFVCDELCSLFTQIGNNKNKDDQRNILIALHRILNTQCTGIMMDAFLTHSDVELIQSMCEKESEIINNTYKVVSDKIIVHKYDRSESTRTRFIVDLIEACANK